MGQKVNPHGLRVGVIKDWDSRWYADADLQTAWLKITTSESSLRRDYTAPEFPKSRLSAPLTA